MKLSDLRKNFSSFSSLSPLEMAVLVIFIIYIILPIKTPLFLAGTVNTPIGLVVILIVTLYLFFYTNPLLGVLYIFVAYELLRRTSLVKTGIVKADNYMIEYTPNEEKREIDMIAMNPRVGLTLEEEVVATMAPAQKFNLNGDISTGYKPVVEKVTGASLYV
jgi:hypothetical protein